MPFSFINLNADKTEDPDYIIGSSPSGSLSGSFDISCTSISASNASFVTQSYTVLGNISASGTLSVGGTSFLQIVSGSTFTGSNFLAPNATIETVNSSNISASVGIQTKQLFITGSSDGSVGTAPIYLTSGTLLTNPVNGAIEYDGNDFFATKANIQGQIVLGIMGTGPSTNSGLVTTDYVGTNTYILATPAQWIDVVINGNTYHIPCYS